MQHDTDYLFSVQLEVLTCGTLIATHDLICPNLVMRINISSLKANLSKYLHAVRSGETVIVMDRNIPIAKVVPFGPSPQHETLLVMSTPNSTPLSSLRWPKRVVTGATARFLEDRE